MSNYRKEYQNIGHVYLSVACTKFRAKKTSNGCNTTNAIGARAFCSRFRHCSFCNAQNTHLSTATGLRIGTLGRSPTAVGLVNVPLVFHNGHHKRHLDSRHSVSEHTRSLYPAASFLPFLSPSSTPSLCLSRSVFLESSNRTAPGFRQSSTVFPKDSVETLGGLASPNATRGFLLSSGNLRN